MNLLITLILVIFGTLFVLSGLIHTYAFFVSVYGWVWDNLSWLWLPIGVAIAFLIDYSEKK